MNAGDDAVSALFAAALAARRNAYAPYSKFPVGAAVRSASGAIFAAANAENASYPVGTCAEAGAVAAMVSAGERVIVEVLVVGGDSRPLTPCGACRQRLREFGGPNVAVHAATPAGVQVQFRLGDLLPDTFSLDTTPSAAAGTPNG